jgi:hypothetical protein
LNAHQRKKYFRARLCKILAGKEDATSLDHRVVDYLRGLSDETQRRIVGKLLGLRRQWCMENDIESSILNIMLAMKSAEHLVLQVCIGWPRVGLHNADETTFPDAVTLYLLGAWEKSPPHRTRPTTFKSKLPRSLQAPSAYAPASGSSP